MSKLTPRARQEHAAGSVNTATPCCQHELVTLGRWRLAYLLSSNLGGLFLCLYWSACKQIHVLLHYYSLLVHTLTTRHNSSEEASTLEILQSRFIQMLCLAVEIAHVQEKPTFCNPTSAQDHSGCQVSQDQNPAACTHWAQPVADRPYNAHKPEPKTKASKNRTQTSPQSR